MKTKYTALYLLMSVCILCAGGCKDDNVQPLPESVPLKMTLNSKNLVMGEKLVATFEVENAKDKNLSVNEDVEVFLSAALEGSGKDVTQQLFENFPASVVMHQGESVLKVEIPVKQTGIDATHRVSFKAFARGYWFGKTLNVASSLLTVSDYHYTMVALKGNPDGEVKEGESFVLTVSVETVMNTPLVVTVTPKEGEESFYEGLPLTLTVPVGEQSVESKVITIKQDGAYLGNKDLTLNLNVNNPNYPLISKNLHVKMIDTDKPLGTRLQDERYVYTYPDRPFVSAGNRAQFDKWYKKESVNIKEGDLHPNKDLAPVWSFLNAMEFHKIDNLIPKSKRPTKNGTFITNFLAANNTAATQKNQAIDVDRYSTTTDEGYLRLWGVKEKRKATGGGSGMKEYGTAGLYCSKFSDGGNVFAPAHTRIYPGIRIEVRARIRGQKNGMNSAIWLMGNSSEGNGANAWPKCGEIDILENPAGPKAGGLNRAYSTLHFAKNVANEEQAPTVYRVMNNFEEWNIYWFEWRSEDELAVGINGETTAVWTRQKDAPESNLWPYDLKMNPNGFKLILSLRLKTRWALGDNPADSWDDGFEGISYEDSKTNPNTPRMEIDWVRFYKSASYQGGGNPVFQKKPY